MLSRPLLVGTWQRQLLFAVPERLTKQIFFCLLTGVGVARKVIEDPILGEDSDSYAVQINEHPNASCSNTKNRVQIKKSSRELTHANIGVLLNLDEHFLNLYLNGKKL